MPTNDKTCKASSARAISRRSALAGAGVAIAGVSLAGRVAAEDAPYRIERDRIRQSICSWCYKPLSIDELCQAAVEIGYRSVELLQPQHFATLKKHGLDCAMTSSHGFTKGFAIPEDHAECIEKLGPAIDATADAGFPNVITFSGITTKISKEDGIKNAVAGLKKIVGHAERRKVNLCIEMLNSRVAVEMKGHPGYLADNVEWVVEVCKQVGSPRLKLLFDIYHVQIMQGDVIQRINEFKDYIAHYHTAGNPGRNDLDDDQEINYPAVMKAIAATGYQGYVGQEFIPKGKDVVAALRAAARTCDV
ncbi:MAG: TIM barrel protein [Pirellulales bacterium]